MRKYFTVVFEVHDKEAFMNQASKFSSLLADCDGEGPLDHGARVTGCGWGDSMTLADAHSALSDYSDEEAIEILLQQEDEDLSAEGVARRVQEIVG